MSHGNILKSKKWSKSGMTKHIFRSTETPTTSLKSGIIHNHALWDLSGISRGIPKSRNGMERREVRISITTGDFNATGKRVCANCCENALYLVHWFGCKLVTCSYFYTLSLILITFRHKSQDYDLNIVFTLRHPIRQLTGKKFPGVIIKRRDYK